MKIATIFVAFAVFCLSNDFLSAQDWKKIDGTDPYINLIYLPENDPDMIIVAADNEEIETPFNPMDDVIKFPQFGGGIFISHDRGDTFGDAKLATFSVYAMLQHPEDDNTYFASVRRVTRGGITISNNAGQTWNETTPFLCEGTYQIIDLATNQEHYPDIYGAGLKTDKGFFHTQDDFQNCEMMDGFAIQSRSVAVSPLVSNLVFLSGDYFYTGGVHRSYDKGKTWLKDSAGIENLRIHCVLPSKYDPAVIFCGADSVTNSHEIIGKGIFMSRDTGKTWTNVGAFGASCFELAQHPYNEEFIVAACGYDGVYLSGSEGYGFENVSDGLPEGTLVTKVAFPFWNDVEEGKVIAFAGTHGDGLYRSDPIYTSVNQKYYDQEQISIMRIYPNPARENITVLLNLIESTNASVSLVDIYGNIILRLNDEYYNQGDNILRINLPEDMPNGAYYLTVQAGRNTTTEMITILK